MIRVVVSFFLSFYYRHVTVKLCIRLCVRVCEIHTIYIYRSLYCLYLVAVLISARRPLSRHVVYSGSPGILFAFRP